MSVPLLDLNVPISLLDSAHVHHEVAVLRFRRFKQGFPGIFRLWADEVSLTDTSLFDLAVLPSSRLTTDAYLAGLAFRKGGRLATLDSAIPWRSVRGADAGLVERIVPAT